MSITEQVDEEVIAALEGADEPMGRAAIFDACPTAANVDQVSASLNRALKLGHVEKMGLGLWSFVPGGVPDAVHEAQRTPATTAQPIPRFGEDSDPLVAAIRSLPTPSPFPQAERRARILDELAAWPAMHNEVAEELRAIANEIKRRAA
jgi:hypothetical protein